MVIQSKKPTAVALVKWLTKKGAEKIQEEHQQAIKDRDNQIQAHQQKISRLHEDHQQAVGEKDATIVLFNDDLKNCEHDNVALQAQRDVFKE